MLIRLADEVERLRDAIRRIADQDATDDDWDLIQRLLQRHRGDA